MDFIPPSILLALVWQIVKLAIGHAGKLDRMERKVIEDMDGGLCYTMCLSYQAVVEGCIGLEVLVARSLPSGQTYRIIQKQKLYTCDPDDPPSLWARFRCLVDADSRPCIVLPAPPESELNAFSKKDIRKEVKELVDKTIIPNLDTSKITKIEGLQVADYRSLKWILFGRTGE